MKTDEKTKWVGEVPVAEDERDGVSGLHRLTVAFTDLQSKWCRHDDHILPTAPAKSCPATVWTSVNARGDTRIEDTLGTATFE